MASTSPLASVRRYAWIAAAVAAVIGAAVLLGELRQSARNTTLPGAARIGGPFTLTSHDGKRFSSDSLAGRPHLVFFGFTHCPDICPTTLLEVTNHLAELGPKADQLAALFITVDPARDTPEHLARYLSAFDKRIIGLTGTEAETDAVRKLYRAYAEKVPGKDGDYTMNHTASVYLMDRSGALASTMTFEENEDVRRKKIARLLDR